MLKELKEHLEQAKNHGEKELPQWLREDERFRLLLRMLEKRVSTAGWLAAFQQSCDPTAGALQSSGTREAPRCFH